MNGRTDAKLGREVNAHLFRKGIQHAGQEHYDSRSGTSQEVAGKLQEVMETLALPMDDSTRGTPLRLARMFTDELFSGLSNSTFPDVSEVENSFYDGIVVEKNIPVHSLCEHHWMPITGVAHVAYFPCGKLLGLSKLNRVVHYFSRRPQVQERLVAQIGSALSFLLDTEDVAVAIEAEHFCVRHRGVGDCGSSTVTMSMGGGFKDVWKQEFYEAIR